MYNDSDLDNIHKNLALSNSDNNEPTVEEALRTRLEQQVCIRALRGRLHWEGDLDMLRMDRTTKVIG